jgi:transposase
MEDLTTTQSKVVAALLAGKSISTAARENGIHRSTIYEWQQSPNFLSALQSARARHQSALYDQVQDLAEEALEILSAALNAADLSTRLRAAQFVIRTAGPGRQIRHNPTESDTFQ